MRSPFVTAFFVLGRVAARRVRSLLTISGGYDILLLKKWKGALYETEKQNRDQSIKMHPFCAFPFVLPAVFNMDPSDISNLKHDWLGASLGGAFCRNDRAAPCVIGWNSHMGDLYSRRICKRLF
jgi:hypothetical protein